MYIGDASSRYLWFHDLLEYSIIKWLIPRYSGMKGDEKKDALCKWEKAWKKFVIEQLEANGNI